MYVAFECARCVGCEHKSRACETHCEEYTLHKLAYEKAVEMFSDSSIGAPKGKCKECKDRHLLCHDNCWDHILYLEYRKIVKAKIRKQKAADSINHLVGIPGLRKGSSYNKNKYSKYVYPN